MRILLIYPPITSSEEIKIEPHPPLGLAYLASFLEKNHYPVKILDALVLGPKHQLSKKFRFGLTDTQIKNEIKNYAPDIVGVSQMFTPYAQDGHRMAKIVKIFNPKIVTVFGGAHSNIDPTLVLKDKNVDFVVRGEGEITFLNLIRALEKGQKELRGVTGIIYRKRETIVRTLPTPFVKNLDELPFPAWHLLPLPLYDRQDDPFVMRHPLTSMITSRGCPGKCVFCSIHATWGHQWRGRSAKNVVDEIEFLVKKYGIREIHFQDDSMSLDPKRMGEICDEIIKRKLDIKWATPNGIAHWTLSMPLLKKMKNSGCYRITFGIESGDSQMRKWIGKPYSLNQAKRLMAANKLGFWTIATYILGFPYETRAQIEKTIQFAIDSDVDFALFYRLAPRWGTPVWKIFEKEGLLPPTKETLYLEGAFCDTKYLKSSQLIVLRNQAYLRFFKRRLVSFLNPKRWLQKIKNLQDLLYALRIAKIGVSLLLKFLFRRSQKITSKTIKGTF